MSKSEDSLDRWDRLVNAKWKALDLKLPSEQEALTGAKRLYRHIMGRPFKGKVRIVTGNRYSWIENLRRSDESKYEMVINRMRTRSVPGGWVAEHNAGWPEIVHGLSHACHRAKNPSARPHDSQQLRIEAGMTDYAISHGFHLGKLKTKAKAKVPVDRVKQRYEAMLKRRVTWESKHKRAANALKKVQREINQYERRHKEKLIAS